MAKLPPPKKTAKTTEEKLNEKVAEVLKHEEEERAKLLAAKLNLPYVNVTTIPVDTEAILLLTEEEAVIGKMAIIQKQEDTLKIIAQDPELEATKNQIKKLADRGLGCKIFVCSPRSLKKVIDRYKSIAEDKASVTGQIIIDKERLSQLQNQLKSIDDIKKSLDAIPHDAAAATYFLENIVVGAL